MNPTVVAIISISSIAAFFLALYLYKQWMEFKKKKNKQDQWPPSFNLCPDYWADIGSGNCQNINNLGRCPISPDSGTIIPNGIINFMGYGAITDPETRRKLCQKAKECGITWEHIDRSC